MINQETFLKKYNFIKEDFDKCGLKWEDLEIIYQDYLIFRTELETTAEMLFSKLMKSDNVHSVRYRIKDPEHLIGKIIRKKIIEKDSNITLENYKDEINDLIGLRALHLFKEGWETINDYIKQTWNLKQKPVANYRKGDSESNISFYQEKGCDTKEHKYGYRSVHYLIETQPAKQKYFAEIQVRTIFEEAWAEIDHTIRYPYDLENPIFYQFLLILNRLSGSADEMGSFIQYLKEELASRESIFKEQIDEKNSIINDLESKLEKIDLQSEELLAVKEDLKKLKAQNTKSSFYERGVFDIGSEYSKFLTRMNPLNDITSGLTKSLHSLNIVTPLPALQHLDALKNIKMPDLPNVASFLPKIN